MAIASFLATTALQQITDDNRDPVGLASLAVANDIYLDDLMTEAYNEDKALQLQEKRIGLLMNYGFHLRKCKSDSERLLSNIPQNLKEFADKEIQGIN